MLGGYTWTHKVDSAKKVIKLDVYLFISASKVIELPEGGKASIRMTTAMPWKGETEFVVDAPEGWSWELRLPEPDYAANIKVCPNMGRESAKLSRFLYRLKQPRQATSSLERLRNLLYL
jgi:DUF1680 family protein